MKKEILDCIIICGAFIVMLVGIYIIYLRLREKQQGFGPNSTKTMGIVLFLPTILILAVMTEMSNEVLATLLGTIAGYVLSSNQE